MRGLLFALVRSLSDWLTYRYPGYPMAPHAFDISGSFIAMQVGDANNYGI